MTTINIENIESTVHEWAAQYYLEECYEHPHNLAEYLYDDHVSHRIQIDPDLANGGIPVEVSVEAVVDAVREALEEIQDDPEYSGAYCPPIMSSDIREVWDNNSSEVDGALQELGGFDELGIESIDQAMSMGVHYYLDDLVRDAAMELLDNISDLEDALEA